MTRAGHPFAAGASVEAGCVSIAEGHVKAVIVAGYVIVYDTGCVWYSDAIFLFEEMVLRLGDAPGPVADVPALLQALAHLYGCAGVIAGNAIHRKGLTRVYEKAGYVPVATRFYKEIPIERSSESIQEGGQ